MLTVALSPLGAFSARAPAPRMQIDASKFNQFEAAQAALDNLGAPWTSGEISDQVNRRRQPMRSAFMSRLASGRPTDGFFGCGCTGRP